MEVADNSAPTGSQPTGDVSGLVKAFRVIGACAILLTSINLLACLVRGVYTDATALIPFAVTIPVVALSIYICREEFKESLRSAHFKTLCLLMAQAGLGLLMASFLLYLCGHRFHTRIDASMYGFNELSGETRETLRELAAIANPVEIVFLEGEKEATAKERERGRRVRTRVQELLRAYQVAADAEARGKLSYRTLAMLERPDELQILAKRSGLTFTREMTDGVLLLRGERSKLILSRELYGLAAVGSGGRMHTSFQGEAVISAALRSLLRDKQKTVYCTVGHGELSKKDTSAFRASLKSQNLIVTELDLSIDPRVPDDATTLVICGPSRKYGADALKTISAYLERGGSLMLLVDPVLPVHTAMAQEPCGLAELVRSYGITLRQDLMTRMFRPDILGNVVGADRFPALPNRHSDSPLLSAIRLERVPAMLAFPCALQLSAESRTESKGDTLLYAVERGSARTWADHPAELRTDANGPGPEGIKAPVPMAAWNRSGAKGKAEPAQDARIVVLATSRILTNAELIKNRGNQIFTRSCIRWLTGEDRLVSASPPRDHALPIATIKPEKSTMLFILLVFGLPGMLAFAGVVVWTIRRN